MHAPLWDEILWGQPKGKEMNIYYILTMHFHTWSQQQRRKVTISNFTHRETEAHKCCKLYNFTSHSTSGGGGVIQTQVSLMGKKNLKAKMVIWEKKQYVEWAKLSVKAKHKVFEFILKLEFLKERNLYMRYVTFLVGFQKKKIVPHWVNLYPAWVQRLGNMDGT